MEHGCSVATISGSRGVLVVGGATGDDVVEFLDWEIRKTWRTLGKLNRSALSLILLGHIGHIIDLGYGYGGLCPQHYP